MNTWQRYKSCHPSHFNKRDRTIEKLLGVLVHDVFVLIF